MTEIGQPVVFVDPVGVEHAAVVTATQGQGDTPSVNLVFVSTDAAKTDPYGRQIERQTSVVHRDNQYAHGMYWKTAA